MKPLLRPGQETGSWVLVEGGSSKDYGCPDGLCPYSNLDTGIVKCYPCPTKQVTVSGSACRSVSSHPAAMMSL